LTSNTQIDGTTTPLRCAEGKTSPVITISPVPFERHAPVCGVKQDAKTVAVARRRNQTPPLENLTEQLQGQHCRIGLWNHTFVADSFKKHNDFRIARQFSDESFYLILIDEL
jgi:hypothetical protein